MRASTCIYAYERERERERERDCGSNSAHVGCLVFFCQNSSLFLVFFFSVLVIAQ